MFHNDCSRLVKFNLNTRRTLQLRTEFKNFRGSLRGHDNANTTDNQCTATQLFLLHLYKRNAIIIHSLDILSENVDSQAAMVVSRACN